MYNCGSKASRKQVFDRSFAQLMNRGKMIKTVNKFKQRRREKNMVTIKRNEYECRLSKMKQAMAERDVDLLVVFGDEYRKENLRYACGFWPIFERGAVLVPSKGEPIVIAAAEGEAIAREMSVWTDIRIVPEFECVTVADKIEYPYAKYTSFSDIKTELLKRGKLKKVGVIGIDAMPKAIYENIAKSFSEFEMMDANSIFQKLRITKSEYEIACFRKAQAMADAGFKELVKACVPGRTEVEVAAAGEFGARKAGAEAIVFCIMASGERTNTVVGRAAPGMLRLRGGLQKDT